MMGRICERGKLTAAMVITELKRRCSVQVAYQYWHDSLLLSTLPWCLDTGPTIAEDKELLSTTQNPILSELRRGKEKKLDVDEKALLKKQLEELRRSYEDLKKQRCVLC